MSLYGAMYTSVTGLQSQSNAMGAISDNLANVNTTAYKSTMMDFASQVTKQASFKEYAAGGVISNARRGVDAQGLLSRTTSSTDLAISGQGFFVVNEAANPSTGDNWAYTRSGSFQVNHEGYLVNSNGFYLQAWPTLPDGSIGYYDTTGALVDINTNIINNTNLKPVNLRNIGGTATASTSVTFAANLPANATIGDAHTSDVLIYDSLGNAQNLSFTWTKTAVNAWDLSIATPADATSLTLNGGAAITFNGDGTPAAINPTDIDIVWANGAANQNVTFDFGTLNLTDGMTQFAGTYSPTLITQDGAAFGSFTGVDISDDGTVTALFDNGETRPIYKIPVATFVNPNGLGTLNGGSYIETDYSGSYVLHTAGEASAGTIAATTLEASNVDIGEQFTAMIITQRAYSAAAKVVTTADEMLDELIRIKR